MMRQPGLHVPQGMNPPFHNINTPHLLPPQPQQQPGQQTPGQANPMGMLPNHTNPTPAMSLLGGGAQPNGTTPNYNLQLAQAQNQRRTQMTQHGMAQGMGLPGQPGMPAMNGPFPNTLVRRVQSQPQGLNQVGAHQGPMHGVPQAMGSVQAMAGISGMNPQYRQFRMFQQQQQQQQQHQPQITGGQGGMQADISILRPGMQNGAAFAPHVGRSASSQGHPMPNMQQSATFPPALPNMSQQFQNNAMQQQQQQHQSQQPQLATSPRPPHNHAGPLPPNLAAQQMAYNRQRMTPEQQNMLLNMQNSQSLQHAGARMPPSTGLSAPFPFPNNAPQNQMGDVQQTMTNGLVGTPGPAQRLTTTPAQVLDQLQGNDPSLNMAPPQQIPPRPPSQQRPPNFQMGPQMSQVAQMHQMPAAAQPSPRQLNQQLQGQRPQSRARGSPQQQNMNGTPRLAPQQAVHTPGGPQPPRMPTMAAQQAGPSAVKPPTPAVAPGHMPITTPRPPPMQPTPTLSSASQASVNGAPQPQAGPAPPPPQEQQQSQPQHQAQQQQQQQQQLQQQAQSQPQRVPPVLPQGATQYPASAIPQLHSKLNASL